MTSYSKSAAIINAAEFIQSNYKETKKTALHTSAAGVLLEAAASHEDASTSNALLTIAAWLLAEILKSKKTLNTSDLITQRRLALLDKLRETQPA